MNNVLRPSLVLLVAFTVVTGVVYPAVVTGIAQGVFPKEANGSLVYHDGKPVGSALIGQQFDAPRYFWGRLSATVPNPYNAAASSGSNLGPTNPALIDEVKGRIAALRDADPTNAALIPVDLVTSSASGLDPEISPAAADYQADRVARARGVPVDAIRAKIKQYTVDRQWGVFGEPRVNVLLLNLALDDALPGSHADPSNAAPNPAQAPSISQSAS
ncbi:potassium-transporting ATPase subunit KdpC [Robbsia andropogonis]|uniref:potassium-transporting ATPase subunit KdpC n=1 Tax=Robbsia andropogonis TaxID=28092 RepID=UPI00046684E2|nr:potassium-transporting ATPase subunit KdpC [Robbsia andropogonis]MCP1119375.1 potassium-transporting ATPase subunit KdpC [Robbsia andropogonis]MCP1129216.1 potassium-transporting ATPase subunit KdpC [Robbsia andropogonis]